MKKIKLNIMFVLVCLFYFSQAQEKQIVPSNKIVFGSTYINIKDNAFPDRVEIFNNYIGYEWHTEMKAQGFKWTSKNCILGAHYSFPHYEEINDSVDSKYDSWNIQFMYGKEITESIKFDFNIYYGFGFSHSSINIKEYGIKKSDDDFMLSLNNQLRYNFNTKGKGPLLSLALRYGIYFDLLSTELLFGRNNIHPLFVPYAQLSLGYVRKS